MESINLIASSVRTGASVRGDYQCATLPPCSLVYRHIASKAMDSKKSQQEKQHDRQAELELETIDEKHHLVARTRTQEH